MKNTRGITLISLVIVIILLIILSGVAISLSIGENGIFNKVVEAREKYEVQEIKEKVEIGIVNQEIEEITLGNAVTIETVLQELLQEGRLESIDKEAMIGNIGEYEVKLKYNKEQKVVIEYIKKAQGIRVTYTLEPLGYTNKEKVLIALKIQGKIKNVIKPDGVSITPENRELIVNYEVTTNGTYKFIIEDETGNKQEKNIIVDTIDRLPPNDFEITAENIEKTIVVNANTQDAEEDEISVKSGLQKYEYFIKLKTDKEYTKYDSNEIKDLEYGTYEVYVVAYDKAGNSKKSNVVEVEIKLTIKFSKISTNTTETSIGIDIEGNLWGWGRNYYGELGDGTTADSFTPKKLSINNTKFIEISVGQGEALAIDEYNNLWAWGSNGYWKIGDGTQSITKVPQKVY